MREQRLEEKERKRTVLAGTLPSPQGLARAGKFLAGKVGKGSVWPISRYAFKGQHAQAEYILEWDRKRAIGLGPLVARPALAGACASGYLKSRWGRRLSERGRSLALSS